MKSLFVCATFLYGLTVHYAFGQIRTEETRASVDTVRGDTTFAKSVIISQSEDITPRNAMIVINPLKFFLFYNLSYFQRLTPNVTIGGGMQAPTISGIDGIGLNAEIRLHPSGKALRGFYVAPNISYNILSSGGVKTSPFSIGILGGWQWFPGDEFAMGLGIGIDYYIGSISDDEGDLDRYDGTAPALRFDIGYAW